MKSEKNWLLKLPNLRRRLLLGSPLAFLFLMGVVTCASPTVIQKSSYNPNIPTLKVSPREVNCSIVSKDGTTEETRCIVLEESDYQAIVRELKSECLGLTGDDKLCQTVEPNTDSINDRKKEGS